MAAAPTVPHDRACIQCSYSLRGLPAVGPLIALIRSWNLLDRLRKHLKSIRTTGAPAVLKGALS